MNLQRLRWCAQRLQVENGNVRYDVIGLGARCVGAPHKQNRRCALNLTAHPPQFRIANSLVLVPEAVSLAGEPVGVVADIGQPDLKHWIAMFRKKQEQDRLEMTIPDDVLRFSGRVTSSRGATWPAASRPPRAGSACQEFSRHLARFTSFPRYRRSVARPSFRPSSQARALLSGVTTLAATNASAELECRALHVFFRRFSWHGTISKESGRK
jgi:hypothetical protein